MENITLNCAEINNIISTITMYLTEECPKGYDITKAINNVTDGKLPSVVLEHIDDVLKMR